MALGQGLGLYRGGEETRKYIVRLIVRKRTGLKQNIKKYQETIYRNIILARPTLERYIGAEGAEANIGKGSPSYSLVNAIGGNNLRALRRSNKGRKYNSNTSKDRNNRSKRLALLGRGPSRQPEVRIQLAKANTKTRNTSIPPTY